MMTNSVGDDGTVDCAQTIRAVGRCQALPNNLATWVRALTNGTDIRTMNRQLGNSAAMTEGHYLKLTANLAAARLA